METRVLGGHTVIAGNIVGGDAVEAAVTVEVAVDAAEPVETGNGVVTAVLGCGGEVAGGGGGEGEGEGAGGFVTYGNGNESAFTLAGAGVRGGGEVTADVVGGCGEDAG